MTDLSPRERAERDLPMIARGLLARWRREWPAPSGPTPATTHELNSGADKVRRFLEEMNRDDHDR